MSNKILVVDDEQEIADLLEVYLKNENNIVYKFYSAKEAVHCIENTDLDLAILDVMLPGMDGFAICKKIRSLNKNFPVIMLTAKDEEIDQIMGLTLGADDYIVKPFRPLEVMARVKAQLRRYQRYNTPVQERDENSVLTHKGLCLNTKTHVCSVDEKNIVLTPTEFSILRILLERKGYVVNSEELFHELWQDEYYSKSNNTITVHIRHLREKLGNRTEHSKYIKTIWGVGYKIEE